MEEISVIKEITELKSQLSYTNNIGFFMGAGTSCALGLPDITNLTSQIESQLKPESLELLKIVKKDHNHHPGNFFSNN